MILPQLKATTQRLWRVQITTVTMHQSVKVSKGQGLEA